MYQTRPDDYDAFRCIAGACPQTCCAAWEIVVDPDAQDAYLRLWHPLAQKLRRVMRVDADGDTYFAQSDGRCPFLCADGLCELQRTLGAQSLCRTCRDFPRWEVLLCDRVEQGLSLARPDHMVRENLAAAEAFACAAQRLLDRHRLAALAAGNVPQRCTDACAGCLKPAALAAAFASPEPLDPQWPELLRRVAALPVCPPPRLTQTQQMCLAQAIVWRHGMDALDDRDVVFPVRYAAAALRLLDCLAAVSERTDAQLVVCVMRETENDPEALPRLRAGLQNTAKL